MKYSEGKLAERLALAGVAQEGIPSLEFEVAVPAAIRPAFQTPEQADAFVESLLGPVVSGLAGLGGPLGLALEAGRLAGLVRAIFGRFPPARRQALARRLFDAFNGRSLRVEAGRLGYVSALDLGEGAADSAICFSVDAGVLLAVKEPLSVEILLATLIGRNFFGRACGLADEEQLTIEDAENTLALFDGIERGGTDPTPYVQAIFRALQGIREPTRGTASTQGSRASFSYIDCPQANVKKKQYAIPDLIGGRYKPLAVLGEGGMGIVFLARNQETGSKVAVKITKGTEEELVRFIREVRLIKDVNHSYVIGIESFNTYGESGDRHAYYAMRYCPWPTLKELQDEGIGTASEETGKPTLWRRNPGKFSMLEYIEILSEVLMGLEAIHRQQLVHRDIKPDNIKYDPETRTPIIMDFGLVKSLRAADAAMTTFGAGGSSTDGPEEPSWGKTRVGATMGTPGYMSPEQTADASNVDQRTDLFAMGVMLYEFLTGERPFEGRNIHETMAKVLADPPKPPSKLNPAIDRKLEAMILKGLEKDPANRYQTANEMRSVLDEYVKQAEAARKAAPAGAKPKKILRVPKKGAAAAAVGDGRLKVEGGRPAQTLPDQPPPVGGAGDELAEEEAGEALQMEPALRPGSGPAAGVPSDESDLSDASSARRLGRSRPGAKHLEPAVPTGALMQRLKRPKVAVAAALGLIAVIVVGAVIFGRSKEPAQRSARATSAGGGSGASRTGTWNVYTEWPFDAAEAKRRQEETAKALGVPVERTISIGGLPLEMVLIPAGDFVMGSPDTEKGRGADEGPAHRVRITQPFFLGKHELPQGIWEKVMGNIPGQFKDPKRPVTQVSWEDCEAFVAKLNAAVKGATAFRLPTEAEWEYACRAGTATRFHWGDDPDGRGLDEYAGKQGAASQRPNPWGVYTLPGGMCEWCQDWYGPYEMDPQTDPKGPVSGSARVQRGGSWYFRDACRSGARRASLPGHRDSSSGMRVVVALGGPPAGQPTPSQPSPAGPSAFRAEWKELTFAGETPKGRLASATAMLYDPVRKRCLLFGGNSGATALFNDLWALNIAAAKWICLDKGGNDGVGQTRPPPIQNHNFYYDEERDLYWLNCDWSHDPKTGTWKPAEKTPKALGIRSGCAYDSDRKRFASFGWFMRFFRPGADQVEDMRLSPQPPITQFADGGLAYDRKNRLFVLFRGAGASNQTWILDPAKKEWRESLSRTHPPPRGFHRLVWHDRIGALVMAGGSTELRKLWLNDLWVYEAAPDRWTEVKPVGTIPPPCESTTCYDASQDLLVLFNAKGQTWVCKIERTGAAPAAGTPRPAPAPSPAVTPALSSSVLAAAPVPTPQPPAAGPSPWKATWKKRGGKLTRDGHVASAFDTKRGLYVVANQWWAVATWSAATEKWEEIYKGTGEGDDKTSPRILYSFSMTYDPGKDCLVTLGDAGLVLFDLSSRQWRWLRGLRARYPALAAGDIGAVCLGDRNLNRLDYDAGAWVNIPAELPVGRDYPRSILCWAAARRQFIFFGGGPYGQPPLADTWSFDPATETWTQLTPSASPPARSHHFVWWDSEHGLVGVWGGQQAGQWLADTWVLDVSRNSWFDVSPAENPPKDTGFIQYDSRNKCGIAWDPKSGDVWTLHIEPAGGKR